MTGILDPLQLRKRLGRDLWGPPVEFGPDGWQFDSNTGRLRVIVTADVPVPEFQGWIHASVSRRDKIPDYEDLVRLHQAVWPEGHAYQCFVPPEKHINIHPRALHLWGKVDGSPVLPDFGRYGSI